MYKSIQDGLETTYCNRHYVNNNATYVDAISIENGDEDIDTDTDNIPYLLLCTESDLGIISMKSHMTILRIVLCLLISLICWNDDGLLKAWNMAHLFCPLLIQVVGLKLLPICKDDLKGDEAIAIGALVILSVASNYQGRKEKKPFLNIKEGMYNIVLFAVTTGISYFIANHMIESVEGYTTFGGGAVGETKGDKELNDGGVTPGGRALWNMMIMTEYSTFMFAATFALFFFDRARKKTVLFIMGVLAMVHALYHLPMEKELWIDAPSRQNFAMGIFVICMVGVVFPSFDEIVVKT